MLAKIQDIKQKLSQTDSNREKVDLLNELAELTRLTDIENSLKFSIDAMELSKKIEYKAGLAYSCWNTGVGYRFLSSYDEAAKYFDKALALYDEMNNKKGKAKIINSYANLFSSRGDYQTSLKYLNQALGLLVAEDEKILKAAILANIGLNYQETGDYPDSLEYYLKSMQIYTENNFSIPENLYNNIGLVYQGMEDFPTALEYYFKSLGLSKEKDNKLDSAFALINIAVVYSILNRHEEALKYLSDSLKILQVLDSKKGALEALSSIGTAYKASDSFEKALEFQFKLLKLREEISDQGGKAVTLDTIGEIYFNMKNYPASMKYFLDSLNISRQLGNKKYETSTLLHLGNLLFRTGENERALDYLYKALELANKRNAQKEILDIHKALYRGYKLAGNIPKALEHHEKFYAVEKEISNLESDKKLKALAIQHRIQDSEKEKSIALRDKEIYRLKNVELARLNEQLNKLDTEKNELLGIAAHDLKNPLSGILSFSRKIHSTFDSLSKENICTYCYEMEKASEKMFGLITDLLDVNAIESGKRNSKIEHFDLTVLCQRVVLDHTAHAESKNIKIHFEHNELPKITADRNALRQILDNLVSNAVKFTPPGKNVYFNIVRENGLVRFSVKDEGPGLTDNDKTKLFSKFARMSAIATAGEHSTGLGLSIVKKLTEFLKGKVSCESERGKGAEFIVELPVNVAGDV
jgi:signal transduction histidine kinase